MQCLALSFKCLQKNKNKNLNKNIYLWNLCCKNFCLPYGSHSLFANCTDFGYKPFLTAKPRYVFKLPNNKLPVRHFSFEVVQIYFVKNLNLLFVA